MLQFYGCLQRSSFCDEFEIHECNYKQDNSEERAQSWALA